MANREGCVSTGTRRFYRAAVSSNSGGPGREGTAGAAGVEPAPSRLTAGRSASLSYTPKKRGLPAKRRHTVRLCNLSGPSDGTEPVTKGPSTVVAADSIVIHADESCLGNQSDGPSPGGAAALIEVRSGGGIARRDLYISAPDTTNNRMALCGAIAAFAVLSRKGRRLRVAYISDSEYLIKGMRDWVPGWEKRGWRRKGGKIENLKLWKTLVRVSREHDPEWDWVRGHAGNPKNEYVNDLAIRAAGEQITSDAAVDSGFSEWLSQERRNGRFIAYDPDADFEDSLAQLSRGD